MAGRSSLTIGDLLYRLGFENDEEFVKSLEGVLKKAESTTEKAGGEAGKAGGRAAGKGFTDQFKATFSGAALGSFLGSALQTAFSGAIAVVQRFAVDSVREFAVYEQGLLQLKLAGETNLSALSQRIQDTAKATKVFSATDVSLAVGELVKAGYDAETAFRLVEAGALGAASEVDPLTGKFGDLTTTAGQLGNILRALGYDTSESGRVMDVLARAAQDSNLNVSDLVDIVARVGPTAKLAGLEIEDLAAMAAVLSNNGMEASLIGTGLRSVLQSLINPAAGIRGELDELGITLVDSQGNLRNFNDVLDGLRELTERGGRGLQTLTEATGSYGSTAAASLGAASETVKEFRRNMEGAEGTAQELADTMRDSAAGSAAELEARLADARAELGEQLMPILLDLNETVLPVLVDLLGGVVGLWEQWEFVLTGTTRAIRDADQALRESVLANLGDELGTAVLRQTELLSQIGEIDQQLANWDRSTDWLGLQRGRLEQQKADLQFELREVRNEISTLRQQRAAAQELANRQAGWAAGAGTPFGPLGPGQARETVATVEEVAAAYRNLAQIQEELKAAQEALANASGPEEEARLKALVAALTAEEEARKRNLGLIQETARAKAAERDPLIEEAQKVQADLQRLKLGYEQGTLTREQYVEAMEAHVRRLDGLYQKVANPTQSLAVLRARQAFLDEQKRLVQESTVKLEPPKVFAVVDMDEVRRQQAIAEARARNNQRMIDELIAQEQALDAWREQHAAERAAQQQAWLDELNAIELAALEAAVQADVEARQREAEQDRKRQEAIAEARARNNERVLAELQAQEAAYTAWLAAEEEKRLAREAELARARASRARTEAVQQALGNLYPGSAGNAANSYTTLAERASGSLVRLAQAQRTLGVATRDDVQKALEGQIAAIERLLPIVEEGSERYYELVAALEQARAALERLNAEVPEARIPGLGSVEAIKSALRDTESKVAQIQAQIASGPDSATLAMLEQRLTFFQALLAQLRQAARDADAAADANKEGEKLQADAEQLASELTDVAASFPKALVQGIRDGDVGEALKNALGGAADYFLDMMLDAILGPIAKELTASIAASLTAQQAGSAAAGAAGAAGSLGALGPIGLVLGGLALVASLASASSQRKQAAERQANVVKAAVGGAPSITYNLTGNVQVNSNAAWSDPAFAARWRSETEALLVSLLGKVRK